MLKEIRFTVPIDIELLTPEFGWQEFFEDQKRGLCEILHHAQKSSIDLYEIDGDEENREAVFISAIIGLLNFICENFDIDINDSGVDEALEFCDLPEDIEFVKQQRKIQVKVMEQSLNVVIHNNKEQILNILLEKRVTGLAWCEIEDYTSELYKKLEEDESLLDQPKEEAIELDKVDIDFYMFNVSSDVTEDLDLIDVIVE